MVNFSALALILGDFYTEQKTGEKWSSLSFAFIQLQPQKHDAEVTNYRYDWYYVTVAQGPHISSHRLNLLRCDWPTLILDLTIFIFEISTKWKWFAYNMTLQFIEFTSKLNEFPVIEVAIIDYLTN